MEKQFVPYEESLTLKKLGFNGKEDYDKILFIIPGYTKQ